MPRITNFLNINNIKHLIIKMNNVYFFIDTTQGGGYILQVTDVSL